MDLILNTENKNINALESSIFFNSDVIDIQKIYDGGSSINYWVKKPKNQNDQVFFSGITPGGFSGEYNKILSIIFVAKKEGGVRIEFKNTKALINDGDATEDVLNQSNMYFDIVNNPIINNNQSNNANGNSNNVIKNNNSAEGQIEEDVTRPEDFSVKIIKDNKINNGNFSLIFYAQDKISGIDHYEIKEGDEDFRVIESPYSLKYQDLTKEIEVKAVDKAGNYRIEKIGPFIIKETKFEIDYKILIASLLFTIFVLILLKVYFDRKDKKNLNDDKIDKIE